MKIEFSRKSMLDALSAVSGVIPSRSPRPVLQSAKLVVDADGQATLSATDLEVGIAYRVLGVRAETPGSVLLSPQRFGSILKTSADETLTLSLHADSKVKIRGAKSEFNLSSEDPETFPAVPGFTAADYFAVSAASLKQAIKRTAFACDLESTRYSLGGVLFELTPSSLTCVGTDGRRLARQVTAAEVEGSPVAEGTTVVPQKTLKLLEKILDDADPAVHIAIDKQGITFRTEAAVIHSRLVEGRFPRYQDVFPNQAEVTIPLNVGEFRRAVDQASITTSEESRGVDFAFGAGVLKLAATAADVGNSAVELPIAHAGRDVLATFDPRYLVDALRVLDDESELTIDLIDAKNAAVLKSADGYRYVIMPLSKSA